MPVDARGQRAEFDHFVPAVDAHVHLVGVHARHHVGGGLADVDVLYQVAGGAVKDRQLVVEPLGLVDDRLIPVGPHVVGVVHVDPRAGPPSW